MRKLTVLLLLIQFTIACLGQEKINTVVSDKTKINLIETLSLKSQFLDTLFYSGRVYFSDGKSNIAQMNYSLLDNGIYFLDKQKRLLKMVGLDKIKNISYSKRFFYVINNEFYEQLFTSQNYSLLLKRKSVIKNNDEAKGPYGISLETSSTSSYSSISESYGKGTTLGENYNKPDKINVDITLNKYYYILYNDKLTGIYKVRDLMKIFPAKKDSIKAYMNDNKIDISNEQDFIRLVSFCVNGK
ncbi:MAG: hypothetical protein HXX16_16635 [Bacteroidales bacterium]|nr:hypothetical protein [Bacteroidales bacterium]